VYLKKIFFSFFFQVCQGTKLTEPAAGLRTVGLRVVVHRF